MAAPLDMLRTARTRAQASNLNVASATQGGTNVANIILIAMGVLGVGTASYSGYSLYNNIQQGEQARGSNATFTIAMIVGARAVLIETPRQRGRFDVVGALCATLGMGALVFGLIESGDAGWASARVVAALAVGVVLLVGLVVTESRAAQPVMPLRLFASRRRWFWLDRLIDL